MENNALKLVVASQEARPSEEYRIQFAALASAGWNCGRTSAGAYGATPRCCANNIDWENTKKRFGLACFVVVDPDDPKGEGDGAEFFDRLEEAQTRARILLRAGRFKYLVLWEGDASGWVLGGGF